MHVPVVLALISFVGVWLIKGNVMIAIGLLWISAAGTVSDFLFGVIPLFVLMGLLVSIAGMGRDTYDIAQVLLRKVRSEEHTSELQSLMRNSYAVFCLKKKNNTTR